MAAAADKKGLKRICTSCGTRFYDFAKRPIICPNCEVEFTGDIKPKTRRSKIAPDPMKELQANKTASANDDEDVVEDDDNVISLEDAEELESAGEDEDSDGPDLDLEDNLDDLDVEGDIEDLDDLDEDDEEEESEEEEKE